MLKIDFFYKILFVVIGIFFTVFLYNFIANNAHFDSFKDYIFEIGYLNLLASTIFYLFSHLLRALRITVMLENHNYSMSNLVGKQFYCNAVNIIIPFKLGEIFRIVELNKLVKDINKTFITIIAERAIDFFILFCGLFTALLIENYQLIQLKFTIALGVLFIISVLLIYFVLPENIKTVNLFLAKRHKGNIVISFLSFTNRIYNVIASLRIIFKNRSSTIVLLSLLIWGCEILGFVYVLSYLDIKLTFLLSFLVFLSSLIYSASLGLSGFQLAFYIVSTLKPDFDFLNMSYIYQFLVFGPAILIGIVIYISMVAKNFINFSRTKKAVVHE